MDSLDLLAREDEFKKLNKQLEKRTESLMKEIEQTMQKQDFFSAFAPSLTLSPAHTTKKHNCDAHRPVTPLETPVTQKKKKQNSNRNSTKLENESNNTNRSCTKFEKGINSDRSGTKFEKGINSDRSGTKFEKGINSERSVTKLESDDVSSSGCDVISIEQNRSRIMCDCCMNKSHSEEKEFLYAFVSVNVKDNVLPQSFLRDRPTVGNVCKFLSSKVKLMQEQIDKLQNTLNKKASQCESHLTQLAELESERMTLLNKCNNMKASSAEMKAKCLAIQHRLEEKEKLYIEQRSISDKLSCEVKQHRSKTSTLEAKCASQQFTIDNLTQQLETVRRAEKEFRDSTRSLSASHQSAISRLEAQIKAQVARMDKQMALIDNLRRQNVLLGTDAAVKSLEREYCEYLQKDF